VIRRARAGDFEAMGRIHRDAYPVDHLSGRLGLGALRDLNRELCGGEAVCLVCEGEEGRIEGFVIADLAENLRGANRRFMLGHAWEVAWLFVRNPRALAQKLGSLWGRVGRGRRVVGSRASMRVVSIAVSPGALGRSVGRRLLVALEKELRERAVEWYGLSVKETNRRAVQFYQRYGFAEEGRGDGGVYFIKRVR